MSAQAAPSGRPSWAVVVWLDDQNVYVELPCKDTAPYIMKFPLSENGLSQALHLMKDARKKPAKANGIASWTGGKQATLPAPKVNRISPAFDDGQRLAARNLLRKLKIT